LANKLKEVYRTSEYDIEVVGGARLGWRDGYHAMLRMSWLRALALIVGGYLLLNALFAVLYVVSDGVANARHGSFADAFFFSVQTMGTVGYGAMYPKTTTANLLVVAESVTGLIFTAVATGLVFVRFARTQPRIVFSSKVTISPMDGIPTLMLRVGNERRNRIVGTVFHATLMRTTRTQEGVTVYRAVDLPLVRARAPALTRSWTVMHRIVDGSPLAGDTPESLARDEVELTLEVVGTDETSLQPLHANFTWWSSSIIWGARLADVLSDLPDGNMLLDLRRFHEIVPTAATDAFPYSAPSPKD